MTDRLSPQRETEIMERWSGIPSSERFGLSVTDTTRPGTLLNALLSAPADVDALRAELTAVRAELAARMEDIAFTDRNTLPDLRREIDHHKAGKERWRKRAREAEATVYELKRPAIEKERNEIRSSMTRLASEAESEGDHEGAAALAQEADKYEAKWRRKDQEMQARIGADSKSEGASS
jgi:hypothetical protein